MSDEASGLNQDRKNLLNRALSMAQGTLTSRILGLFRDILMGALFDRVVTDAWVAAFRLPNFFRRLLGEGLLAGAFIPLYIEAKQQEHSGQKQQEFLNLVWTSMLMILVTISLLGTVFMEPILRILLAKAAFTPQKWQWTVWSGQIMFAFVGFVTSGALYGAILQTRGKYGWVGFAPALLNISMLGFMLIPAKSFSFPGESLAWGVLVGGLLQFLLLGIVARVEGLRVRFSLQNAGSMKGSLLLFYRRLGAGMVGVGIFQFSALISLYFASGLAEGSISALYWSDRLLEFPLSLIAVTLGASLLPLLSSAAQENDLRFWKLSVDTFSLGLFWAVPAGVGLFLFAEPLVEVLFMRGEFKQSDLLLTTSVLRIQALSLIFMSMNRVLLPIYYSRQQTRLPFWASLTGLAIQIFLSNWFLKESNGPNLIQMLMWAGFISHLSVSVILLIGIGSNFYWQDAGVRAVKILVSAGSIFFVFKGFAWIKIQEPGGSCILLALGILVSVTVYFLAANLMGSPEAVRTRQLFQPLLFRLRQMGLRL